MTQYCHILLIEDDNWLRQGLEQFLRLQKFQVSAVANLCAAKAVLKSQSENNPVRIVVSDVSLPDGQALALFGELQAQEQVGKIFISASVSEQDRIAGLKAGADDYLCKPVYPEELLLRIKALLRRIHIQREEKSEIRFLHYQLDPESRILSFDQRQVQLSNAEHQLLIQLVARQGKIVSRDNLFSSLDNTEIYQQGRALDILVCRLRRKMQGENSSKDPIVTYRGKGYLLLQS